MAVRVLLADDSTIIRKAIAHLLQQEPTVQLVAEASDFTQTLARELKPNIVILDPHMPHIAGFTPQRVRKSLASCCDSILAISLRSDKETLMLAEEFGAVCLLDKMELAQKLIPVILKASSADKTFHKLGGTTAGDGVPPCEA